MNARETLARRGLASCSGDNAGPNTIMSRSIRGREEA